MTKKTIQTTESVSAHDKNNPNQTAVKFQAHVFSISTLTKSGLRVVLDLPEASPETIVALFDGRKPGTVLSIVAKLATAKSLTKLDKNENNQKNPEAGPADVGSGRFIHPGNQ
jgi:hypothetical protein